MFSEFPFHMGTVYRAPLQVGPANSLWAKPTGYRASMAGFPYDDLEQWRSVYLPVVFVSHLEKVSTGIAAAIGELKRTVRQPAPALAEEASFAEVASIHFASVANQSRYVFCPKGQGTLPQWSG